MMPLRAYKSGAKWHSSKTMAVKAKQYDWQDSNLALFGSDTEKSVKKESAQAEPAWHGSGAKAGIEIWRIVKFKVEPWAKDEYGKFYGGDSYIILNTYKVEDQLKYDVHFWIGKDSTQDEYGTAAYKTVELDTYHDDKPIQHREVMGYESELFKKYFKSIQIMEGGADSGFKHVEPEQYKPRLLHIRSENAKSSTEVREVALKRGMINSDDVFILDAGTKGYLWQGKTSNKNEKYKGAQVIQEIKSDRIGRITFETIEEGDHGTEVNEFFSFLSDEPVTEADATQSKMVPIKKLYRLSDSGGSMQFSLEEDGAFHWSKLDSNDVFIADMGTECYVWIGSGASSDEKKNGMSYAHNYLSGTDHALVPISVVKQGSEPAGFSSKFQ